MNLKTIKIIGMGATILGAVTSLVASWASEKQQEAVIAEKVAEAVGKLSIEDKVIETINTLANADTNAN